MTPHSDDHLQVNINLTPHITVKIRKKLHKRKQRTDIIIYTIAVTSRGMAITKSKAPPERILISNLMRQQLFTALYFARHLFYERKPTEVVKPFGTFVLLAFHFP